MRLCVNCGAEATGKTCETCGCLIVKHDMDMTTSEYANIWCRSQGRQVPSNPVEWQAMYEEWIDFAFADFG